ncbi:MAG: hypothetical protein ACRDY6_14440, partial [Acidimicrobiia bacterium]
LYRNELLFHQVDGERSPQVAQVLLSLQRDGLMDPGRFTSREEEAIALLSELLESGSRAAATHG